MKNKALFILLAIGVLSVPLMAGDTGIPNWVSWAVSAVALVVGIFIPAPYAQKFKLIKNGLLTFIRVGDKFLEAKHKDSEEGKKISQAEWDAIFGELRSAIEIFKPLIGK